jgi:hypothetical protein
MSDHLFRLIKSLSKNEKVYIKRNASFHMLRGQKNNYIRLFDALDRMKEYDEPQLIKKFSGEQFVRTLPAARNYLFHVILRNLESYNSSIRSEIRGCLNQVEILVEKGLTDPCLKIIAKAEALALKYNLTEEYYSIWVWKMTLSGRETNTGKHLLETGQLYAGIRENLDELKQAALDEYELKLINHRCSQLGLARNEADILDLENMLADIEKQRKKGDHSFPSSFMHFHKLTTLYQALNKPMKELLFRRKKLELFAANLHMLDIAPYLYLFPSELEKTFQLELSLGYYDQLHENFDRLFKQCRQSKTHRKLLEVYLYQLRFSACLQTGLFDAAWGHSRKAFSALTALDPTPVLDSLHTRLRLDCAILHLFQHNHKAALRSLDELLSSESIQSQTDLYYFAQILQLLVFFEKGDIELLLYKTRSAYRTLYRNKKLYKAEKMLLDFLRKENEAGWDKKTEPEVFALFRTKVNELFRNHPEEKKFLTYFDLPAWVESKIDKNNVSLVLQKKHKRLFESAAGKSLMSHLSKED